MCVCVCVCVSLHHCCFRLKQHLADSKGDQPGVTSHVIRLSSGLKIEIHSRDLRSSSLDMIVIPADKYLKHTLNSVSQLINYGMSAIDLLARIQICLGPVSAGTITVQPPYDTAWASLKDVSSLTLPHYLWRLLGPFNVLCAQMWP